MNKELTIIITMAGLGERFRKAGYDCPKYMIQAKGKTLFEWSMDSLLGYNNKVIKYIFVVRKEDNATEFIKEKMNKYKIDNIDVVSIDYLTEGEGNHWSFVKLNNYGKVEEVREKVRISNNCTLGAYYFSSAHLYKELYEEYYNDNKHLEKNEKYIAPLYNYMLYKKMSVTISIIDKNKVHVLGTPEELEKFIYE